MPRPTAPILAALGPDADGPTDAELLRRFVEGRDAGAFELLVWRHAGLVLRACRVVLRDHHDAEDAAQAVFLALARQAPSVGRRGNPAGWLFRVARRVAGRAARRRRQDPAVSDIGLDDLPAPTQAPGRDPDLDQILHEELNRLPEKYQAPVVLCFLEGLTHTTAARRLGWPIGTVAGRLARAKALLGARLTRRGVALPAAVVAGAVVPPSFAGTTAEAAVTFIQGGDRGIPDTVLDLVHREVRVMFMTRSLRAVGVVVAGAGLALGLGWVAAAAPRPASAVVSTDPIPPEVVKPRKAVVQKTFALAPVTTSLQRRLLGADAETLAVVFVDGSGLLGNPEALVVTAFDLQELQKALAGYRPIPNRASLAVELVNLTTGDGRDRGRQWVECALEGAGRRAGFAAVRVHCEFVPGPYFSFTAYTRQLLDEADGAEEGVGDDRARVFPVRTTLSRVLANGADGVVDVRTPLKARAGVEIPAEVDRSVRGALEKADLAKGKKVKVLFNVVGYDDRNLNQTVERVRSAAQGWADAFGLELGSLGL